LFENGDHGGGVALLVVAENAHFAAFALHLLCRHDEAAIEFETASAFDAGGRDGQHEGGAHVAVAGFHALRGHFARGAGGQVERRAHLESLGREARVGGHNVFHADTVGFRDAVERFAALHNVGARACLGKCAQADKRENEQKKDALEEIRRFHSAFGIYFAAKIHIFLELLLFYRKYSVNLHNNSKILTQNNYYEKAFC